MRNTGRICRRSRQMQEKCKKNAISRGAAKTLCEKRKIRENRDENNEPQWKRQVEKRAKCRAEDPLSRKRSMGQRNVTFYKMQEICKVVKR